MNERFKELASLATAWCGANAKGTPVAWEWEEKFAELIIQDCIGVAADAEDEEYFQESGPEAGVHKAIRNIKSNFGM